MTTMRFHLALPVRDIKATRTFYETVLNCAIGRSSYNWIDVNFYGNQITFQERPDVQVEAANKRQNGSGPIAHFGVILPWKDWHEHVADFQERELPFMIEPGLAMEGLPGEQKRFFLFDPNGYGIEFKAFEDPEAVFRS